jgi:hypothetical protein
MHKVEFALSFFSFYFFFPLLPFGNSSPKSWEELMGVSLCKKMVIIDGRRAKNTF